MATSDGFKVEGLARVVPDLKAMGLEVDDLKDAFSTIAAEGAEVAASYAPRRTGRLAGPVRGNRARSKAVIAAGRASLPYAGPINYGWPRRGIRASGFMQKADQVMQPIALRRLEDEINKRIRAKGLN